MIWDCTMVRDELSMLECRLIEMQDYDVTHVLVESLVTHRGETKPLHYAENRERFAPWKERIRNVTVPRSAFRPDASPWEREHIQRNMAWLALDPEPDDLVLISDVDEIPSREVLEHRPLTAACIMQRCACFAVDWLWPGLEPTGVLVRADLLNGRSLGEARDNRGSFPAIGNGGWHLSWMGGHEAQMAKLASHCHEEQDVPLNLDRITSGRAYREGWHIGIKLIPADVDETWPRYVYNRVMGKEPCCPASWFRLREERCRRCGSANLGTEIAAGQKFLCCNDCTWSES